MSLPGSLLRPLQARLRLRFRRWPLGAQLGLAFAALAGAALLCLALLLGGMAEDQERQRAAEGLTELATSMSQQLDRDMRARIAQLEVLARLPVLVEAREDPDAAMRLLDDLRARFGIYAWVGLVDEDSGRVVASTGRILLGREVSHRNWFQGGRHGTFFGDVHEAMLLAPFITRPGEEAPRLVDVALPLRRADGTPARLVLGAHLDWRWARRVEQGLFRNRHAAPGTSLFVLALDGQVLLAPEGTPAPPRLSLGAVAETQAEARPAARVEAWPDGTRYLTVAAQGRGFEDYPGLGWTAVARLPLEVAEAPGRKLRHRLLAGAALAAALLGLAGWLAARRIAAPLGRIALAATALRDGRAGVALPSEGGAREIATLSESLRDMVESLTRSRAALEQAEDAAQHDPLTGLLNRAGFTRLVEQARRRAGLSRGTLTLVLADLDGFKPVNDLHGHAAGDLVLQEVARRLSACLRAGDGVARLGGDEFALLVETDDPAGLAPEAVMRRLDSVLDQPIRLSAGVEARVGCSLGAAVWNPAEPRNFAEVMASADAALYAAKRARAPRQPSLVG